MENFEQRWIDTEFMLRERFGKLPDMEGILFLIGMNELGAPPTEKFTKEQKQDLMHVAVCTLLSQEGYFQYAGHDADGWPHFEALKSPSADGVQAQEKMLKQCVIRYFDQ